MKKITAFLLALLMLLTLCACGIDIDIPEEPDDPILPVITDAPQPTDDPEPTPEPTAEPEPTPEPLDESGYYTTKEDVALYLHLYGHLPDNFITKKEAQALGWPGGGLDKYMKDGCIGGSYFGNYEGALPEAPGREYHECDIDTLGAGSRGAKRIVYSNDGLIFYTDDHYETFELLYGGDEP